MPLPRQTAIEHALPAPLLFGPFVLHVDTGELKKRGVRVRLSGQPFQILLLLIANPGGLVTREELRDRLWSDGTFVDFEHGVNAAINKLRRALGDAAEHPRYIETVPGRGYRFIGSLEPARDPVRSIESSGCEQSGTTAARRNRPLSVAAVAAVASLAVLIVLWWSDHPSDHRPWKVVRLTADTGISDDPALSPDGRLLAYSSDAEARNERDLSAGGTDLYVKQVAGGSPIRLTFDGAGNTMPDFSPDGSRIVFRSSREGGGIFEMPALGGEARFIVKEGFNPRFSPDGSQIAYWVGAQSVAATVPGNGAVWIVPLAGGRPQRVGAKFTTARYPIWHKDGRHLLILGYPSTRAFDSSAIDWWLVATDESTAVRTGAYEALLRAGIEPGNSRRTPVRIIPQPYCWSSQSHKVTFSMPDGDSSNLWQLEVSPRTGKVAGTPQRLTTGAGSDVRASCTPRGDFVFAKVETRRDVWLLPFDLNLATPTGVPERMTHGLPSHDNPSLARNGRFAAFVSDRSGRGNIWRRDLATGRDLSVAPSSFVQRFPVSNASGDSVAFSVYEQDKRVVYVATPGGEAQRVCDGCLRATDWTLDGETLVVHGGDPTQINLLDIASRRQVPLVTSALNVLYGRLSPDNHWISFTVRDAPNRSEIVIAPVDGFRPVPEGSWITIAEVEPDDYANWSPDGTTLYFTSSRDGFNCVWGRRLETGSLQPVGESFVVQHFHGRLYFDHGGWSAAAGRIAIPLAEKTGNLWMMTRSEAR
jgi:Tol biopolymer transport system component/DNA-binding winged helix-turn-helix (wHTH) protein